MNEEHTPIINEQPAPPQEDWKHHFTTMTPLSKILAMLLFVALPFVGFWVGVQYLRQQPNVIIGVPNGDVPLTLNQNNERLGNEGVTIDFVLSPLSAPKAKIDIYWNYTSPEEAQSTDKNFFFGTFVAVAEPLHLIESAAITNNSPNPIFLKSINNEQVDYLTVKPKVEVKVTPIMLLPDAFLVGDDTLAICHGREVTKLLHSIPHTPLSLPVNNECVFEKPIQVESGKTIIVRPIPYIVSYGPAGQMINDPFGGKEKSILKHNMPILGGEHWLMPSEFQKYYDVLGGDAFNIGGYIVANTQDTDLMKRIFDLRDTQGQPISFFVGNVDKEDTAFLTYNISQGPFRVSSNDTFDKQTLGLQMFLYLNAFLAVESITGVFDSTTISSLKKFQEIAHVYPTGVFDEATAHAVRGSDFINLIRLYENYGDEIVTFSFDVDSPFLRYWGWGKNSVSIKDPVKEIKLIASFARKEDSHGATIGFTDGSSEGYSYNIFSLLNNTADTQSCVVANTHGVVIERFSINTNTMYGFGDQRQSVSIAGGYTLICGTKTLKIDLSPVK